MRKILICIDSKIEKYLYTIFYLSWLQIVQIVDLIADPIVLGRWIGYRYVIKITSDSDGDGMKQASEE